jgi:hypothetical protein
MTGQLSFQTLIIGTLLVPLVFVKSSLVFALMTRFKLRARTSLLATLNLTNYSEFGLIVAAIGVSNGWLSSEWLVVIAIALSLSFVVSAPLNKIDDRIYSQFRDFWLRFQTQQRLSDDTLLNTLGASIAVFGMGRVGTGAYDRMHEYHPKTVVGIDFDAEVIKRHQSTGRNVLDGDPSDADFWDKIEKTHSIELVMLALPNLQANLDALEQLKKISFSGRIAVTAGYQEDEAKLLDSGATAVFNIYTEAGAGFADNIEANQ